MMREMHVTHDVFFMKANPGGQIDSADIIGRDGVIAELWERLAQQSIVLTAERRMGKTTIIKQMVKDGGANVFPIYRDLEKVVSPAEFVSNILTDISAYQPGIKWFEGLLGKFTKNFAGWQIGNIIKIPETSTDRWKEILENAIEYAMSHPFSVDDWDDGQKAKQIIFFWDELPMMLDNFLKRENGPLVAMEVLDTLRALRQTYPQLRMVYTGSIGLHHVISKLKDAGYNNAPTNDMYTCDLQPLDSGDAIDLAERLLEGENVSMTDRSAVAREISQQVDRIPFYIHHLILKLKSLRQSISPIIVKEQIDLALCDPKPWDMDHYQDRIKTYYRNGSKEIALSILDTLAMEAGGLSLEQIRDRNVAIQDLEGFRTVLKLLRQDGYLAMNIDKTYCFRYGLIQRYWQYQRGN
jgi:AAA+ ATPase superfamily predicted ATPase